MGMVSHNLGIVGKCALLFVQTLEANQSKLFMYFYLPLAKTCMRCTNET